MRHILDEIAFRFFELTYSVRTFYERISDRTKYITLSFLVVSWLAFCVLVFLETYNYEAEEYPDNVFVNIDGSLQALYLAEDLSEQGLDSEAFNLLATQRNHFSKKYSEKQLEKLNISLSLLAKKAEEITISELYASEDLTVQQPIYKFRGIVSAIDNDPMYGTTYTITENGTRTNEQLEVSGLTDVSLESEVEFYGVPRFDTVSSPIKVEAFVVPVEQEDNGL